MKSLTFPACFAQVRAVSMLVETDTGLVGISLPWDVMQGEQVALECCAWWLWLCFMESR